jgi:hypothetical protein
MPQFNLPCFCGDLPCFCGDLQAILFAMSENIRYLQEENRGLRENARVLENRLDTLIPGLGESRWRDHTYRSDPTRRTYADEMVRSWLGVPFEFHSSVHGVGCGFLQARSVVRSWGS